MNTHLKYVSKVLRLNFDVLITWPIFVRFRYFLQQWKDMVEHLIFQWIVFKKVNNYREEMKKKICNFFNFVYAGRKIITGDALILADLRNVICFVRYRIFVKTEWVLLPWTDDFIIIAQTDIFANIRGQYWTNFK